MRTAVQGLVCRCGWVGAHLAVMALLSMVSLPYSSLIGHAHMYFLWSRPKGMWKIFLPLVCFL